jgi:nitroimidazol reductase NimA-like FMN-containing flavoprotein (pyridoxamine 5'-phosphate oxidase superfamily)
MRRIDKEIADPGKIAAVLNQAQIIHLGLLDGDRPYIVPLNFGYAENTIYFHCAREGKKIDLIKINNTVCFQTEVDVQVLNADNVPDCTTYYKSVIGYGKAYVIENAREKKQAADILMDHYLGNDEKGRKHQYGTCMKDVCMIKIEIDSMTGKQTLPAQPD